MSIIELLSSDGFTFKRQAATNGGEHAGPCPFCGGKDRFRVWPEQKDGRYWCRICGKAGDSIQYLRDHRGLSFADACKVLGREPGPRLNITSPVSEKWKPKETNLPPDIWQVKARDFLDKAIYILWAPEGEAMRTWLRDVKGLNDTTIKTSDLGMNIEDIYEPRAYWGLDSVFKEDGTERWQWLPVGLVIPHIIGSAVHRLRIRRNDLGEGSPYIVASGSDMRPMILGGQNKGAAIIVESELDGFLLNQEAGYFVTCVAMGSAQAKPDKITDEHLNKAEKILVALDADDAGAKSAWLWWMKQYSNAKRWPCLGGKDPSESRLSGLDLRDWVVAGIFGTEEIFERFCIQTIDGGLSDAEAIKAMGA